MLTSPGREQVRGLAPDPSAARSGERLATRRHWSSVGHSERAAWGLCQGSASAPYQVVVDLAGPAFKCSCPSRKLPCKHGLGLLFLLDADPDASVPAQPPEWAQGWLAGREARATTATRPEKTPEVDEEARQKRAAAREKKVAAGVAELDRWLQDLVRRGLAAAKAEGYGFWDSAAARLVDAQAPGLAGFVRGMGALVNSGPGWPDATVERAARLHLAAQAYGRLDRLPQAVRPDVRSAVGWTVREEELPEENAVADRWLVVGRRVTVGERVTTARTWLIGETSGRFALHLAFGAGGALPAIVALPGAVVRATFAFYPSATPLRAAVRGTPEPDGEFTAVPALSGSSQVAERFAELLAANPFVEAWPVAVSGVVPDLREGSLLLRDAEDEVAPAHGVDPLRVFALGGGRPVTVIGEWLGRSLRVVSAVADGRFVHLVEDDDEVLELASDRASGRPEVEYGADGSDGAWRDLVSRALLGTERAANGRGGEHARGEDSRLLAGIPAFEERTRESALLATAAVADLQRRAGWLPAVDPAPRVAPSAEESQPVVSKLAAGHLRRILAERRELLAEWLALVAAARRRPPDEELPALLRTAAGDAATAERLSAVVGPRARWLAALVPELGAGIVHGATDPERAFVEASGPARRAVILAAVRRTDPAAGRALLEGQWAELGGEDRARCLAALASGLRAEDESFLESALEDRRAEVRAAACDLLARLPGSAYSRRMEARAADLLALAGRLRPGLEVRLPGSFDESMERDGLSRKPPAGLGERAWWLRQIVARTRPDLWPRRLGADARGLIERALRSDAARPVVEGWVEAALRFRDPAWAAALLRQERTLELVESRGIDPLALLDVLSAAEREELVERAMAVADIAAAARMAGACPPPWSARLGRAVLVALHGEAREDYPEQGFYDLVRLAARRLPPSLVDDFEAVLEQRERLARSVPLAEAADLLRFRHQMSLALRGEQ